MVTGADPDIQPGDLVAWTRIKVLRGQVRVNRAMQGIAVEVRNGIVTVRVGRRLMRAPIHKVTVLKEVADGFWFPRSGSFFDLAKVIEDYRDPFFKETLMVRTFVAEEVRLD